MLLHYQGVSVNVEGELLAVQSDQDGARHIVSHLIRDLLTECVHMIIPDVVMGVVKSGDGQTTSGHLRLNLSSWVIIITIIIMSSLCT